MKKIITLILSFSFCALNSSAQTPYIKDQQLEVLEQIPKPKRMLSDSSQQIKVEENTSRDVDSVQDEESNEVNAIETEPLDD